MSAFDRKLTATCGVTAGGGRRTLMHVMSAVAARHNTGVHVSDSPARMVVAFHGDELNLSVRDRAVFELVHLITGQRLPHATLMYVWDAQLPVGTVANYARTSASATS